MNKIESPWRKDFPALYETMHGKPLAFLDSAASAQKPQIVIDSMNDILTGGYSNIHRGLYEISQNLTQSFEDVRKKVSSFIGAESEKNIVFTRNTTEGINVVAQSWARYNLVQGDEILITEMEHHANIVPWQILANQIGIIVRVLSILPDGSLDLEKLPTLLNDKTKLVSFVEISNALGTINPVNDIIKQVRAYNSDIKILVDGTQAVVHRTVNVTDMDCDFYVFTGHKLYAPSGIGVLYGKYEYLNTMPPYQGGGDMIEKVSFRSETIYRDAPYKFEAGTPAIVEVIGLGAAIDYLSAIGMDKIAEHETLILNYATDRIQSIRGLELFGVQNLEAKIGVLSFAMPNTHSSDIGMVLDQCGIAVRTGHHCTMPLMEALGLDSTTRASIGLYTNSDDIDALIIGLKKVEDFFG